MKNEEKAFMIFLLVVMLLMVLLSFNYSGASKILPLLSGVCSVLIMAFLVMVAFSSRLKLWYQKFEKKAVLSEESLKPEEKKREISIIIWFSGCTAVIYLLGFVIGIPLFLFTFLKIWARESWLLSVVLSGIVLFIVYFTFIYILSVPLHRGILFAY